ncbi:MAG: sarcosine oxidase subunit gamma family protein [Aestuariivita sp.]|uniref:sarcosine oxidase subunit gamma n=1 Tax=Aestuariivita sp. TaxID=1872407 RepID=UPI003BAE6228
MSDAIRVLNHARCQGIADISEIGPQGMITLRGDLSSAKLKAATKAATGLTLPGTNRLNANDTGAICWMSPDELLLLCPYDEVAKTLDGLHSALAKEHALAVDVSDARAVFAVSGTRAREVMSKLCPVDLSPQAFTPGMLRRTRMAQVPAALWMRDEESFQIICFRSVAQYVFDLLSVAAQDGSEVNAF